MRGRVSGGIGGDFGGLGPTDKEIFFPFADLENEKTAYFPAFSGLEPQLIVLSLPGLSHGWAEGEKQFPKENRIVFTLTYKAEFHAAHHLPNYQGKCQKNHGHNWIAEITCRAAELDEQGMVADFAVLKAVCPDHEDLNEWMEGPPTTENVAREIYTRLEAQGVPVTRVQLWENARACVTYETRRDGR